MFPRPHACLAILILVGAAIVGQPSEARADEGRGVGYVLSFRLGVEQTQAKEFVDELASATTTWLGRTSKQGKPVAKSCAGNKDCVRRTAATLGVSRLGMVAVVAAGGVVRLEVRLLDASTGSEIVRTHAEFETSGNASSAEKAIFDLMPRLLPGEKVAPIITEPTPPPNKEPVSVVPPVTQIAPTPLPPSNNLDLTATAPKKSGTRWWLWGGLGAAATASIVAAILLTRDDGSSAPVLDLPPAQ